jgi:DNA-binding PadR family transcriptional regulator
MSLPHAILGFLRDRPMTGYDLKTQCFDESVAHFWPADQAQIYRTLDKLTEQGFIENTLEIQEDRPNRKIYHITDTGRAELERWLHAEIPLAPYREPFLVQLFFSQSVSKASLVEQLEKQLSEHRARLATYEAIEISDADSAEYQKSVILARMTLDYGKQIEHTNIAWLLDCMEKIKALAD